MAHHFGGHTLISLVLEILDAAARGVVARRAFEEDDCAVGRSPYRISQVTRVYLLGADAHAHAAAHGGVERDVVAVVEWIGEVRELLVDGD